MKNRFTIRNLSLTLLAMKNYRVRTRHLINSGFAKKPKHPV